MSIATNKKYFAIPERRARDCFSCIVGYIIQYFHELVFNCFAQILCSQMKWGIENTTGDRENEKKIGKKKREGGFPIKSSSIHSNYTEKKNKI